MSYKGRTLAAALALIFAPVAALADNVFVVDANYSTVTQAVVGRLQAKGHTVTTGGPPTSLTGYQQVWDLRYPTALTGTETSLYTNFITNGGFAYFTTENPGCCTARNNSVASLIMGLGGGNTVIGGANGMTANVSGWVNTTYITQGITINFAAISAITNSQGIPLFKDSNGLIQAMSWIGRAGALGSGVTGTIITVSDINWLDSSRFVVGGTSAQQQNVQALDDIINGIVAGTVGGTISSNGNGAAASNGAAQQQQQQQQQNQTPTIVSTSTTNQVTSSTSNSSTSSTAQVTYSVSNLDGNGYGTVQNYTDTVVVTTPVTTTTTTTTPVTTDTYSDGSTVVTNGTSVVTSSSSEGTPSSQITATVLNYTSTIAPAVSSAIAVSQTLPVVTTKEYAYVKRDVDNNQRVRKQTTTTVTTPMVTTTTTTPVTTTVYANGTTTVYEGTPSYTYAYSENIDVSDSYDFYHGRIDQLEVMDKVNSGINALLTHEPITNHKRRFRVFDNTRFAQSYNVDDYKADTRILGGGFEYDLTKGWTAGAQYNHVNINLNGVDSRTHSTRQHVGVFNSFHGKNAALVTNAGASLDNYNYNRTVEGIFNNSGETTGQQWWVSNRLYVNNSGWFKPFLGYTVSNMRRNAYDETGDSRSARSVGASNQTTHVGEAGLKIETRFGGKKHDAFGVSVDGAYGTDKSYGITAALDYKEVLFVEGSRGVSDGVTTNSIAGKVKFRF